MSVRSLFGDIMIISSLVVWVFHERYIDCSTGFIGPAFGRKYDRIWLAVQSVWPISLPASGGPLWGMSQWVTGGIGWPWIFLICQFRLRKVSTICTVIVDCFSRWTEACPLPNKTAWAVADAFSQLIVCRFGMLAVIHSDQGREFENNLMQELCLLCGAHKTRTTPYHPASDGLVERYDRTLLMMLAMFAGENHDDWDDLLLAVMMAYHSSVHESTDEHSAYHLMFREECTLPMDVGLPRRDQDLPDPIKNPYALWVRDALEVAYDQVRHSGQAVGVQMHPDSPVLMVHCQDLKKIPRPRGLVSWINMNPPELLPTPAVLDASTVCRSTQGSVSAAGPVARQLQSDGRIADSTQPSPGSVLSDPEVSAVNLSSVTRSWIVSFLPQDVQSIDSDHILHPFFCHRLDVGPFASLRLLMHSTTGLQCLRDGVKLAAQVGRSRKAARLILGDADIPWGHQVAVMF